MDFQLAIILIKISVWGAEGFTDCFQSKSSSPVAKLLLMLDKGTRLFLRKCSAAAGSLPLPRCLPTSWASILPAEASPSRPSERSLGSQPQVNLEVHLAFLFLVFLQHCFHSIPASGELLKLMPWAQGKQVSCSRFPV